MTQPRYSIPYFFMPDEDAIVQSQPSCTNADNVARYGKVTLGTYAAEFGKWQYEKK